MQFIAQETSYGVLLVTNGREALRTLKALKPNLLLLDYRLPGMNGIELYDHLQAMPERVGIPAIMLSATLPYRDIAQRNIVGMQKPVDIDKLLQSIENLIH